MAKRRIVSNEITTDKWFNRLSIESQALWPRLLACSDDFGVLPGDPEELMPLINCPVKLRKDFEKYIAELCENLMWRLTYEGETYIIFKPAAFQRHQSFINNKRTKSEYLKLQKEDVLQIFAEFSDSRKILEIPENSGNTTGVEEKESGTVESRKQQVESRKRGSAEGVQKELPDFLDLMPDELKADPDLVKAWQEFLHMRAVTRKKGREPVKTERAARDLFSELVKIRDPVLRIACVNKSTAREWLDFFPDKFLRNNGQFENARSISEGVAKTSFQSRLAFDPRSEESERNRSRLEAELTIAEREQRGSDQ